MRRVDLDLSLLPAPSTADSPEDELDRILRTLPLDVGPAVDDLVDEVATRRAASMVIGLLRKITERRNGPAPKAARVLLRALGDGVATLDEIAKANRVAKSSVARQVATLQRHMQETATSE